MANKTEHKDTAQQQKATRAPERFGLRQFYTRREKPMGKSLDYFAWRQARGKRDKQEARL